MKYSLIYEFIFTYLILNKLSITQEHFLFYEYAFKLIISHSILLKIMTYAITFNQY